MSFAFFEASEALPKAKTLLSVGYCEAFLIPAGQQFKVCQQTSNDATVEGRKEIPAIIYE